MIVEWIVKAALTIVQWLVSLFPSWEVPGWLTGFDVQVNNITAQIGGMGSWVDWVFILSVVGTVLAVYGIIFGIQMIRTGAAHVPFFGGKG